MLVFIVVLVVIVVVLVVIVAGMLNIAYIYSFIYKPLQV
jgi:hypothetical protein